MHTNARSPSGLIRCGQRRGFTLFELLVTISIIVIATAVVLPAFASIVRSSNFASAVNTVTATLGNARALAIRNNEYTAVAFLFDTDTEEFTLLPLVLLSEEGGSLSLYATTVATNTNANAFQPAPASVPVVLPAGTGVYGYSFQTEPAGSRIDNGNGSTVSRTMHWYAGEVILDGNLLVTPWIFPRNDPKHFMNNGTDPYDVIRDGGGAGVTLTDADTALRHAQSFMIMFSPEGTVVESVPRNGQSLFNAYIEYPNLPQDETNGVFNPETGEFFPYDDIGAFDPENRGELSSLQEPVDPLDVQENPEVLLRSVTMLAVVSLDELKKTEGIAGLEDPWFVRSFGLGEDTVAPFRTDLEEDSQSRYYDADNTTQRVISTWIDANGEIIGFNRYTGNIIRRSE